MATFNFQNIADSNLQDITDVNYASLAVDWHTFTGAIGTNLTYDTKGSGTVTDGELAVTSVAADPTYAALLGPDSEVGLYII